MAAPNVEQSTRLAIVDGNKCKPSKCNQECKRFCPVVMMGKLCVEVTRTSKISKISESLCNGCGQCVKKCPFGAIRIINLPKELNGETSHRYSKNSFKLHRLPMPKRGSILALIGANGTGKSTAIEILSEKGKPNLGRFDNPPSWAEIVEHFRGSGLQNYYKEMAENRLKTVVKPQHVYLLGKKDPKRKVSAIFKEIMIKEILENDEQHKDELADAPTDIVVQAMKDHFGERFSVIEAMDLEKLMDRNVGDLSGGELQRMAIAIATIVKADVRMYDEPSSFLDIYQRVQASKLISQTVQSDPDAYCIVVEHDLSIVEFMSDYGCILYGNPGNYGVVTSPYGIREAVNVFLDGYLPQQNVRFRDEELVFRPNLGMEEQEDVGPTFSQEYPEISATLGDFKLKVEAGSFSDSEIIVLLGQNGTGKSTFIKLLAGKLKADSGVEMPELFISYKPQHVQISPEFHGNSVREFLQRRIPVAYTDSRFVSDVIKPLKMESIMNSLVGTLSGGEIQRLAIVICLGIPAAVYLIDEPSAMLDAEQRLVAAKVIKRFVRDFKKTAFIVEHDFVMATYMADRVIVYDGVPSVSCRANTPMGILPGMNLFLKDLGVTFRKDSRNFRPRINKFNSSLDREQKKNGNLFYYDL